MNEPLRPEEAAHALTQIQDSQTRVIDVHFIPVWYWWLIAGLSLALAVVADSRNSLALAIGVPVFVIGVLAGTAFVVRGALHVKPRGDLLGANGVLLILGFVAVVVGSTLGLAFTLQALGVAHPATYGMALCAVWLVGGGPLLIRSLRRIMLRNRDGVEA
jgi:hypothetical protein